MQVPRPTPNDVLAARLDALSGQIAYLVERQRKQEELFEEMTPILKEVMATAVTRLDALEKKGLFAFARELGRVGERVMEGYSPADVRKLGDAVVSILDAVRAMTQPEVLLVAEEASEVLRTADEAEPIGLLGMVRASRDEEVQKGMAVMLELLRHVGRGASVVAAQRRGSPAEQRRARLAEQTAPRKARGALGIERPAREAAAPRRDACAAPAPAGQVATVIDGVGFTADGHLADAAAWTHELGERIADLQGVSLTEAHWRLIDFARGEFAAHGASPNVRRVTQGAAISTKDLYTLFPKAPARTLAKIAGIPKPVGCV